MIDFTTTTITTWGCGQISSLYAVTFGMMFLNVEIFTEMRSQPCMCEGYVHVTNPRTELADVWPKLHTCSRFQVFILQITGIAATGLLFSAMPAEVP